MTRFKTLDEVRQKYGDDSLVKIINLKQIVTYAKMQCQPVWIDKGLDGKLVAYYVKTETSMAWKHWKSRSSH